VSPKKKLIEVALPLEAINKASAKEKSIRHGHPSTLHLWWARRRLFNSPPQSPKAFMQF
jgi:putative DNA methylase